MDRIIVYPGSIPQDTDILNTNRNTMIGLGYLAQMLAGTSTLVSGLACEPTSPASLTVTVGDGSILSLETVDNTAYGSLPADSYPLVKIGINAGALTSFALTPPSTSGDSINYLIEATFSETDVNPLVLPYYNASNPSQPYSGPNGSGTSQNTLRQQVVELQLKAGVAAPAGTQTTPAVDSGYVGLWVVTVNYGQTAITSADIAEYPGAPFLPYTLPALAGGFEANLSANGYQKLPSGLIIQWGAGTYNGASGSITTYNFPISFPNTPLSITGTVGDQVAGVSMGFQLINSSQFGVGFWSASGGAASNTEFTWMAVGF